MRVLSWNLRHLHDSREAIVRVLRSADADVVCLQEGPRLRFSTALRRLAADAGLRVAGGGWPAAGNAVLCSPRLAVEAAETHRFPGSGRLGQRRGTAIATVGGVRFASIHLGLDAAERLRHVELLLSRLGPGPAVVAGDLNEPPSGPSWAALATRVRDPAPGAPPTFPARAPRVRIDAILVSEQVGVAEYGAWRPDPADAVAATDHLPVLGVLEPPG